MFWDRDGLALKPSHHTMKRYDKPKTVSVTYPVRNPKRSRRGRFALHAPKHAIIYSPKAVLLETEDRLPFLRFRPKTTPLPLYPVGCRAVLAALLVAFGVRFSCSLSCCYLRRLLAPCVFVL